MRFIALLLLLLSPACFAKENDWEDVEAALREYVDYPSSENANNAVKALPLEHAPWGNSSPAYRSSRFMYENRQFSMLSHQVAAGHEESVRLAFRLFSIADGAFVEDLQIILGALIRAEPQLFLTELERSALPQSYYYGLALNDGEAFVDRLDAQCLEAQRKIDSLNSVTDPRVHSVKQTLVSIIAGFVAEYCTQSNRARQPTPAARLAAELKR